MDKTNGWNKRVQPEDVAQLLTDYNTDTDYDDNYNLAYEIVRNSTKGNTLAYAIQENIVAHAVREAGYDSVIGYSKKKDGTPFISEIFDVRETTYPMEDTESDIHDTFRMATASTAGATKAELSKAAKAWAERGTESEYFQKWFKGSKVVDADGKPLVVSHGTDKQFTIFKGYNYFTTSKRMAAEFSENNRDVAEEFGSLYDGTPTVMPVYLSIKNPYIVDDYEDLTAIAYNDSIPDLIKEGYDGAMSKDMESIVAFSPTLIKSATGNRGTFSAVDPDIRMAATPNKKATFAFAMTDQGFEAARLGQQPSVIDKAKEMLTEIGHVLTRTYKHINPSRYQLFFEAMNRFEKANAIAADKAYMSIRTILHGLNRAECKLFNMKVYLDDVVESVELAKKNETIYELPPWLPIEHLQKEVDHVNELVSKSTKVQEALSKREDIFDDIRDEYIKWAKELNINTDTKFLRHNYFRHQVLAYADATRRGGTRKVLTNPKPSALKHRSGKHNEYNTNYVESEYEVMFQLIYATQKMKFLSEIYNQENIIKRLRAEAKDAIIAQGIEKPTSTQVDDYVSKHIPNGYVETTTGDMHVFMAHAVNERIAKQLLNAAAESIGITKDDLHKIFVMASRTDLVIPEAIHKTLMDMEAREVQVTWNKVSNVVAMPLRYWKRWSLIFPKRFMMYNFRNATGDADAMYTWQPGTLTKLKPAVQQLWDAYVKHEVSPAIQYYIDQGGLATTLQEQEMNNLRKIKDFKNFYDQKGNLNPHLLRKYWQAAQAVTNFREQIGRVAAYLYYKEQWDKGNKIYGVSRRSHIDALLTNEDRAYRLSNELLGAYDEVSVFVKWLRKYGIPFASFPYVNITRNFQGIYNTFTHSEGYNQYYGKVLAAIVGRKLASVAIRSPFIAYRAARLAMKLATFAAMFRLFDYLAFWDEEEELPLDVRRKPHLTLGRNPDGTVRYISNLGVLGDFLEWSGLDDTERYIDDFRNGRMTIADIVKDMLLSPTKKLANGTSPYIKLPVELISKRTYFPDWTRPRMMRYSGQTDSTKPR